MNKFFFQKDFAKHPYQLVFFDENHTICISSNHECHDVRKTCSMCRKFIQNNCTAIAGQNCAIGKVVDFADLPSEFQDIFKTSVYYEEQPVDSSTQEFEEILKRLCNAVSKFSVVVGKWVDWDSTSHYESNDCNYPNFTCGEASFFIKKLAKFSGLVPAVMMNYDALYYDDDDGNDIDLCLDLWLIEYAKKKLLENEMKEVVDGVFALVYLLGKYRLDELRTILMGMSYEILLIVTEYIEKNVPSTKYDI